MTAAAWERLWADVLTGALVFVGVPFIWALLVFGFIALYKYLSSRSWWH